MSRLTAWLDIHTDHDWSAEVLLLVQRPSDQFDLPGALASALLATDLVLRAACD